MPSTRFTPPAPAPGTYLAKGTPERRTRDSLLTDESVVCWWDSRGLSPPSNLGWLLHDGHRILEAALPQNEVDEALQSSQLPCEGLLKLLLVCKSFPPALGGRGFKLGCSFNVQWLQALAPSPACCHLQPKFLLSKGKGAPRAIARPEEQSMAASARQRPKGEGKDSASAATGGGTGVQNIQGATQGGDRTH